MMKAHWFNRNNHDHLLLFFAGWGMDPHPFEFLGADSHDVVMFYDYTDDTPAMDVDELFSAYTRVDLAAWSLGVAVVHGQADSFRGRINRAIAINGVITPIHERCGIPPEIFAGTVEHLLDGGVERFRRRMCRGRSARERFSSTLPDRTPDDLHRELVALQDRFSRSVPEWSLFDEAWIGKDDRIIPAENQARSWELFEVPFTLVDAPHFPFYRWTAWEELLCP